MKNNKGIALITLIVTIIVLIILAEITLKFTLREEGIIKQAKLAKDRYENIERDEQHQLNKLYSSIKVASDSQITLTMQELNDYIEEKINEKYLYYTFKITKSGSGISNFNYSNYFTIPNTKEYEHFSTTYAIVTGSGYAETWEITPLINSIYIYSTSNSARGTLKVTVCYKKID